VHFALSRCMRFDPVDRLVSQVSESRESPEISSRERIIISVVLRMNSLEATQAPPPRGGQQGRPARTVRQVLVLTSAAGFRAGTRGIPLRLPACLLQAPPPRPAAAVHGPRAH